MKVLIVEDDRVLSDTIKKCLSEYKIEQAYDGYEGYIFAKQNIYDAIVLDLMLPEMNGYEMLEKLRLEKVNTPVLILTAKDGIDDKVKGLKIGGDDYLTKPFERQELIARVEALIRRSNGVYANNLLQFKDLILDFSNREIKINEEKINLYGKQFEMLEYLISNKNTIITKEQMFEKIWGFDSETTANVVEVYASSLRKELKRFEYDKYIKTIRGLGYMISEEE